MARMGITLNYRFLLRKERVYLSWYPSPIWDVSEVIDKVGTRWPWYFGGDNEKKKLVDMDLNPVLLVPGFLGSILHPWIRTPVRRSVSGCACSTPNMTFSPSSTPCTTPKPVRNSMQFRLNSVHACPICF